jgi:uncharacterized Ntn-hydrolase superfamily protein
MTFSIVARSADGSMLGTAVSSRCLAVGRAVPAGRIDLGAIATQARCNLTYREQGLAQLELGKTAEEAVTALITGDPVANHRQLGIVDVDGNSASHTGPDCLPWAGGCTGPGYAIQGNILAGPQVIEAMERAWLDSDPDEPLGRRMLAALLAGDRAGGDRRGRQSAAIMLYSQEGAYEGGCDEWANLRVDDHHDPVLELIRLLDLREVFLVNPTGNGMVSLEGEVLDEVAVLLQRVGYPVASREVGDVSKALNAWAFDEFLTTRVTDIALDRAALGVLRERAGTTWRHWGPVQFLHTAGHEEPVAAT